MYKNLDTLTLIELINTIMSEAHATGRLDYVQHYLIVAELNDRDVFTW